MDLPFPGNTNRRRMERARITGGGDSSTNISPSAKSSAVTKAAAGMEVPPAVSGGRIGSTWAAIVGGAYKVGDEPKPENRESANKTRGIEKEAGMREDNGGEESTHTSSSEKSSAVITKAANGMVSGGSRIGSTWAAVVGGAVKVGDDPEPEHDESANKTGGIGKERKKKKKEKKLIFGTNDTTINRSLAPTPHKNLFWLHIQKAGTSLFNTLYLHFCPRLLSLHPDLANQSNPLLEYSLVKEYPQKEWCDDHRFLNWPTVGFHHPFPSTSQVKEEGEFTTFAMLRDPAVRLKSAFSFRKHTKKKVPHYSKLGDSNISFSTYIKEPQVRIITQIYGCIIGICTFRMDYLRPNFVSHLPFLLLCPLK